MYDASYDKIEYLPCAIYRTDSILNRDPILTDTYKGSGLDSILVTDFSTLRLFKNDDPFWTTFSDAYLVFEWVDENGVKYGVGGDYPGLTISLTELLGAGLVKMGRTYSQRELDKINRWEIRMDLWETYMTGVIHVLGWEVQIKNVTGGLYPI
jgi:hypothetical protein